MSCITCDLSLKTQQWGGCDCPVWDTSGDTREVKTTVNVAAAPPAINAGAVDFAPGTVLITSDGVAWAIPASAAALEAAVAQAVVVCAPLHKVAQAYPAAMEIVLRTAKTGIYDNLMLFPAAFTPANKALALTVMQSNGFERKQIYA